MRESPLTASSALLPADMAAFTASSVATTFSEGVSARCRVVRIESSCPVAHLAAMPASEGTVVGERVVCPEGCAVIDITLLRNLIARIVIHERVLVSSSQMNIRLPGIDTRIDLRLVVIVGGVEYL